jgi:hypothetical protein
MLTEEDFLFRPVLRGVLRAESLVDGTVDLAFIMVLNDALDVQDENDLRARQK